MASRSVASELVARLEQATPRERLPQHHAQAVDVGGGRGLVAADELRRDVGELALDHARGRQRDAIHGPGEPEIGELRDPVDVDQDVAGRDITVEDGRRSAFAIYPLVGAVQSTRDGGADGDHGLPRRRHPVATMGEEPAAQVEPLDPLHDDEVAAALVQAEVLHLDDVRVAEVGDDPRLLDEHGREVLALGQTRQHALDGHRAREARGAAYASAPDGRHASAARGL